MTTTTNPEKPKHTPKAKAAKPAEENGAGQEQAKPKRRTAAQRIADLKAEIERVQEREAARELRADPAVKLTAQAVRALNKARGEAEDRELVQALDAARATLATYLQGKGLRVPLARRKRERAEQAA